MSDADSRRTIKGWAGRLSIDGELLTLDEARTLAAIASCDRLLECLTALQDVQMRLTRLELFLGAVTPAYDPTTRALAAATSDELCTTRQP